MSEDPLKKWKRNNDRLNDAKKAAMQDYKNRGFQVDPSNNHRFCFSATDRARTHECKVRVVIDEITVEDRSIIKDLIILQNQRKEIMCRKYASSHWIREIYDHLNNRCQ